VLANWQLGLTKATKAETSLVEAKSSIIRSYSNSAMPILSLKFVCVRQIYPISCGVYPVYFSYKIPQLSLGYASGLFFNNIIYKLV
jgi:hypothetical protein